MIAVCIIVIAVCLLFSSFFSSADICFSSVNKLKLQKEVKKGNKNAKIVLNYINNYSSTISTILFGNNLVNIIASSFGALLATYLFPNTDFGPIIIEVILLILIITFGEILPKSFSKPYAYRLSIIYIYPIKFLRIIFYPITWAASGITKLITSPFTSTKKREIPTDDELDSMIEEIQEEGIIDENASKLLHRSIEFKETSAYEIMTPRVSIQGIDYNENVFNWVNSHLPVTKSRLIVYKGNADKIVGYIPSKTLLKAVISGNKEIDISSVILPIISVPATMEISSILMLMKKSHHHIAVVKDEYGGTDGILTLEDILEELVGEMYDEGDKITPYIKEVDKNKFIVNGKIDIDNFFHKFNLDLDRIDEDYSTLSGWIVDKLDRFAKVGDKLQYEKVDIKIVSVTDFTINEVEIIYHPRRKKKNA